MGGPTNRRNKNNKSLLCEGEEKSQMKRRYGRGHGATRNSSTGKKVHAMRAERLLE